MTELTLEANGLTFEFVLCLWLPLLPSIPFAGWVTGFTEALIQKPKVRDFENLSEEILSLKGLRGKSPEFYKITNLGSTNFSNIVLGLTSFQCSIKTRLILYT